MLYTINELRQKLFQHVYDVYDIFLNFFGEEYVDLQGIPAEQSILDALDTEEIENEDNYEVSYDINDAQLQDLTNHFSNPPYPFILVWWPEVTITNENDKSIRIQDLYAKIEVTINGTIPYENLGFLLNRSTYSNTQFTAGYVHSHLSSRYRNNHITDGFTQPCLGTGPIKRTIADLKNNDEEPLWMLFCQELALYVTVESLRGVPYRKLEEVHKPNLVRLSGYTSEYRDHVFFPTLFYGEEPYNYEWFTNLLRSFTAYYCNNGHLAFSFENGKYICGMSYYDFIIDISNAFINWFNQYGTAADTEYLYAKEIIKEAIVKDRKFYKTSNSSSSFLQAYEGQSMGFTFKGNDVLLHIFQESGPSSQTSILLSDRIAQYILQSITQIINYHYGNEQPASLPESREGSLTTASPTAHQTICYI